MTISLLAGPLATEPIKKSGRERLIAHLEMTGGLLADEMRGLSQKQLTARTEAVQHQSNGLPVDIVTCR